MEIRPVVRSVVRPAVNPISERFGSSWQSWWTHLISATVENAAPTKVVMTFATDKPALGASDFTIADKTISGASWAGAVLTLTLSEAIIIFEGNLTVTFVKTGQTATVTNNVVDDGNTVAWFRFYIASSVIKDGANRVSQWSDLTGLGHHLLQPDGASQPLFEADGILFDGVNDFMKCNPFAFIQPEMIYFVGKGMNYFSTFNDGNASISGLFYATAVNNLRITSGGGPLNNPNYTLKTFYIYRTLFNGLNSFLTINTNNVNGNVGITNMDGFTLAARGGMTNYGNIKVKEIILRKSADNATIQGLIYNYLKKVNGL